MKWIRKLKWVAGVCSLVAVFAAVPAVYGGLRWTGIDPELDVDGHTVNVRVEWPEGYTCSVSNPVLIVISVPRNAEYSSAMESSDSFDCGPGETEISTHTIVVEQSKPDRVEVSAWLRASERFPARVLVYEDGERELTCRGVSNHFIACRPLKLDD